MNRYPRPFRYVMMAFWTLMLIVHSALIFIIGSALMNGLFVAISVFWLGLHIYEISDEEDYKRKTRMEEQDNVLP